MAKPFEEWFHGPWRLIEEVALSMRVKLAPGEMMPHRTGLVILNCPACNAMQVGTSVTGPPDAPTMKAPVHCGKGFCDACGVWFTVVGGVTREAAKPPGRPARIPPHMRGAGVHAPPSLEVELKKVEREQGG